MQTIVTSGFAAFIMYYHHICVNFVDKTTYHPSLLLSRNIELPPVNILPMEVTTNPQVLVIHKLSGKYEHT